MADLIQTYIYNYIEDIFKATEQAKVEQISEDIYNLIEHKFVEGDNQKTINLKLEKSIVFVWLKELVEEGLVKVKNTVNNPDTKDLAGVANALAEDNLLFITLTQDNTGEIVFVCYDLDSRI